MNKQSKGTSNGKNSSKNPLGMLGANYCFVKYSEIEALRRSANDASIALSRLAKASADIKLMSLRPDLKPTAWTNAGLSQKLTDTWATRHNTPLPSRISEADAFGLNTEKISKSIDSPLPDSPDGQTRKSRRRCT